MYTITDDNNNILHIKYPKVKVGTKIDFTLITPEFKELKLSDHKGLKVISIFPSINTKICDRQTKEISKMASTYGDVTFISVCPDLPPAIAEWCAATDNKNILIGSDYMERRFGKKYGYLIDEIKLLNRGAMILDNDNVIQYITYNTALNDHIDFDTLKAKMSELRK